MMNFEDQTNGWEVLFRGLISPFANRFKTYIKEEINGLLKDHDSDSSSGKTDSKSERKSESQIV
jgi:hypothetical protein